MSQGTESAMDRISRDFQPPTDFGYVPCNGCTLCCQGDAVRLLPQDDPTQYLTEPHDRVPGALMLAHKANRDCIYLGDGGCTIQDRKPLMCREMDCRNVHSSLGYTAARRLGVITIWERGRFLKTLLREGGDSK